MSQTEHIIASGRTALTSFAPIQQYADKFVNDDALISMYITKQGLRFRALAEDRVSNFDYSLLDWHEWKSDTIYERVFFRAADLAFLFKFPASKRGGSTFVRISAERLVMSVTLNNGTETSTEISVAKPEKIDAEPPDVGLDIIGKLNVRAFIHKNYLPELVKTLKAMNHVLIACSTDEHGVPRITFTKHGGGDYPQTISFPARNPSRIPHGTVIGSFAHVAFDAAELRDLLVAGSKMPGFEYVSVEYGVQAGAKLLTPLRLIVSTPDAFNTVTLWLAPIVLEEEEPPQPLNSVDAPASNR